MQKIAPDKHDEIITFSAKGSENSKNHNEREVIILEKKKSNYRFKQVRSAAHMLERLFCDCSDSRLDQSPQGQAIVIRQQISEEPFEPSNRLKCKQQSSLDDLLLDVQSSENYIVSLGGSGDQSALPEEVEKNDDKSHPTTSASITAAVFKIETAVE